MFTWVLPILRFIAQPRYSGQLSEVLLVPTIIITCFRRRLGRLSPMRLRACPRSAQSSADRIRSAGPPTVLVPHTGASTWSIIIRIYRMQVRTVTYTQCFPMDDALPCLRPCRRCCMMIRAAPGRHYIIREYSV